RLAGGPAWHPPGGALRGEWRTEWSDATEPQSGTRLEAGEYRAEGRDALLLLDTVSAAGRWRQEYRLGPDDARLRLRVTWQNGGAGPRLVHAFHYVLSGIAIGGGLEGNAYFYPPTWLHFMTGPLAGATPAEM